MKETSANAFDPQKKRYIPYLSFFNEVAADIAQQIPADAIKK